eukprot:TRINITY_DN786_c2_g2_i1.p1 TRINITY_DN786_c2_g2~~TRINITY_DN786_c2_g2_i1.p1  ORF type:complete len:631 (+),score=156.74 TRINITY_DN786_c2_g2_i1:51-1943(+)
MESKELLEKEAKLALDGMNGRQLAGLRCARTDGISKVLNAVLVLLGHKSPTWEEARRELADSRNLLRSLKQFKPVKLPGHAVRYLDGFIEEKEGEMEGETVASLRKWVISMFRCCKLTPAEKAIRVSVSTSPRRAVSQRLSMSEVGEASFPAAGTPTPKTPYTFDWSQDTNHGVLECEPSITRAIQKVQKGMSGAIVVGGSQGRNILLDRRGLLEKVLGVVLETSHCAVPVSSIEVTENEITDIITGRKTPLNKVLSAQKVQKHDLQSFLSYFETILFPSKKGHVVATLSHGEGRLYIVLLSNDVSCGVSTSHIKECMFPSTHMTPSPRGSLLTQVLLSVFTGEPDEDRIVYIASEGRSMSPEVGMHSPYSPQPREGSVRGAGTAVGGTTLLRNKAVLTRLRCGGVNVKVKKAVEAAMLLMGEQPGVGWEGYQRAMCDPNIWKKMEAVKTAGKRPSISHEAEKRLQSLMTNSTSTERLDEDMEAVVDLLQKWTVEVMALRSTVSVAVDKPSTPRAGSAKRTVNPADARVLRDEAWMQFRKLVSRDMSEGDLQNVSFETLQKLITVYNMDHPVTSARLELRWAELNGQSLQTTVQPPLPPPPPLPSPTYPRGHDHSPILKLLDSRLSRKSY